MPYGESIPHGKIFVLYLPQLKSSQTYVRLHKGTNSRRGRLPGPSDSCPDSYICPTPKYVNQIPWWKPHCVPKDENLPEDSSRQKFENKVLKPTEEWLREASSEDWVRWSGFDKCIERPCSKCKGTVNTSGVECEKCSGSGGERKFFLPVMISPPERGKELDKCYDDFRNMFQPSIFKEYKASNRETAVQLQNLSQEDIKGLFKAWRAKNSERASLWEIQPA